MGEPADEVPPHLAVTFADHLEDVPRHQMPVAGLGRPHKPGPEIEHAFLRVAACPLGVIDHSVVLAPLRMSEPKLTQLCALDDAAPAISGLARFHVPIAKHGAKLLLCNSPHTVSADVPDKRFTTPIVREEELLIY